MSSICIAALDARLRRSKGLTLEVSGRCHSGRQITVARRSGPLDRIVRHQTLRRKAVEFDARRERFCSD